MPAILSLELGLCSSLARAVADSAQERYQYTRGIFCGLRGSVTALHADERDNRLAVLSGWKAVFLISPEDVRGVSMMELAGLNVAIIEQLGAPLLGKFRPSGGGLGGPASSHIIKGVTVRCFLLRPGLQLEIPRFWLHCVQNLTDCVGVSAWDRVRTGGTGTRCATLRRSPPAPVPPAARPLPQTLWGSVAVGAFAADPRGVGSLLAVSKQVQSAVQHEFLWAAVLRQRWLLEPDDFAAVEAPSGSTDPRRNFRLCRRAEEAVCKLLGLPLRRYRGPVGEHGTSAEEDSEALPDPFDTFSGQQVGWLLFAHCVRSGELARAKVGRLIGGDLHIQPRQQATDQAPEMLKGFMAKVDMAGCSLVEALRRMLQVLTLPGEARLIDTILAALALRFSEVGGAAEEETAMSFDSAHVLLFSLLMLSTDLHNPRVLRKMSENDFVAPQRGVNDGMNFSEELIRGYYRSIASGALFAIASPRQPRGPQLPFTRPCAMQ